MQVPTPYPSGLDLLTGHERRTDNHCWRPDGTPVPLLIHTRSGRAEVVTSGSGPPLEITGGDTVLWNAGVPQDFGCGSDEPWEIVWMHFHPRPHWRDWLSWSALGPGVSWIPAPQPRIRSRVEAALMEAVEAANSGSPQAHGLALNALERAILWLDTANPGLRQLDDRIHDAVLFVARHLDGPLSVQTIAEAVHLSPSRLSHLFTEQVGVSPSKFVEQRRIERAQGLLESSSLPVAAVAEATGFSSQFYFAHRCRAVAGMSPSSWRRRCAGSSP